MNSLANTKAATRNKFTIVGDFDIFGKLPCDDKHYDIQNDDDLDDFKNAKSFVVKRRLTKEKRPKNQSKLSVVSYGNCRKMLELDLSSLDVTKNAIRKKFAIVGDFHILGKMPADEHPLDIQNDEELDDCRDAESFLVKKGLKTKQSDDELAHTKVNLKMKFEAHDEFVTIDLECLRSTRNAISQKLNIDDDFKLLVKKDGVGDYIDVDDDKVLATLTTEDILLVERKSEESDTSEPGQIVLRSKSQVVTKDMPLVNVGVDEEYCITKTPSYKSLIVRNEAMTIQKDVCIPSISAKLKEVEECLRIAYYGTVDNKELRGETQKMQFDIQKLCADCDTTMLRIKLKITDILDELQCGFGYLLDGYEDYGFKRLGSVGPIAKEIQKAAVGLTTQISDDEKATRATLKQVEELKEGKATRPHAVPQSKVRLVVDKRKEDVAHSESRIRSLDDCERIAVDAERQHLKSDSGIGFGIMKLITRGFYEGNKPQAEQEERFAREMREEQAKERERLEKLKEEEMKAKIEFTKLEERANAKEISEVAIQAAQTGFKTLRSFLQSLATFWESSGLQFNRLQNLQFLDDLKKMNDLEERKRFWASKMFKSQAMTSIARFVAIQEMCEDFHETMTTVLDDIHHCIGDNPTVDEAKARLPKLVKQFKKRKEGREEAEEQDRDIEAVS